MKAIKRIASALLAALTCLTIAAGAFATTSTVNPNVPAQNSPLSSSSLRAGISQPAYNDINALFGLTVPFGTANPGLVPQTAGAASSYFLSAGGSWMVPNGTPAGSSGQLQYNNAGSPGGLTVSGDCSLATPGGAITCTKTNGSNFAASATTDATNANNILNGTLGIRYGGTGLAVNATTAANIYSYAQAVGHYGMLECDSNWPNESASQQAISLQNCLLKAQRMALLNGAARQANLGMTGVVDFDVFGSSPNLACAIVWPRYVRPVFYNVFVRDGTGASSSNWDGNPANCNLGNLYEPFMIFPPTTQQAGIHITHLNSNGTDGGSGPFYGKTWRVMTLTIASGGSGFSGGETCTMANGDALAPAAGASFTVASASGGAATALTFSPTRWQSIGGQYYLPPYLQAQQWTSANGWDGHDSNHPAVFSSGNYVTTCSGGTGLTVTPTWWPDWCDGTNGCSSSATYDGDFGNLLASTGYLQHIVAVQSRQSTSASYGKTRAFAADSFDLDIGRVQTGQASIGMFLSGSDTRVSWVNDVGSALQFKMRGGSHHITNAIWDTPVDNVGSDAHAAEIDACTNCSVDHFSAFHNANSGATVGNQQVRLGSDLSISNASAMNSGLYMNGQFYSDATSPQTTLTAYTCGYTNNSRLWATVSNINSAGSARASQFNIVGQTTTNCANSVLLNGSLDNSPTNDIFNGTGVGWLVFDPQKVRYNGPSTITYAARNAPVFSWTNASSSDINYIQVSGGLTTSNPVVTAISKSGGDSNVDLGLSTTGSGAINFWTEGATVRQFRVLDTASAVNYLAVTGGTNASSAGPTLSVATSDAESNVPMTLNTLGSGAIRLNAHFRSTAGGTPSINSCGSGAAIGGGTDNSFTLSMGSGTLTSCLVTFGTQWTTAPTVCTLTPTNATAAAWNTTGAYVSSISTSTLTITGLNLTSASYGVHCY